MNSRIVFFLLGALWIIPSAIFAQNGDSRMNPDSVNSALVPAVGYSSNQGLAGGAVFSRINATGDIKPFKSYLKGSAMVSTKGFVDVEAVHERTRNFGRPIRSTV
ncbi:MAG TPA: hypothetical protein VK074_02220, partial [Fodinibius sp.]|nr:hypothetical protein [Fodinibius sp.]